MTTEIIEKIETSGYKKKHIAKTIGCTPEYLYLCMTGQRTLSLRKELKLLDLLKLQPAHNAQ